MTSSFDSTDDLNFGFRPTLSVWDNSGTLVLRCSLARDVCSFGAQNCDFNHDVFGARIFFAEKNAAGCVLFDDTNQKERISLPFGQSKALWGFYFALTRESTRASEKKSDVQNEHRMLDTLMDWVAQPMQGAQGLLPALENFLRLVGTHCDALSGLLVLADERGFSLITQFGIDVSGAEDIWKKMPPTLTEEVLRTGARTILPEGLREKQSADHATIYVRDIRSVVGFPLCAENQVLGVFYLNFRNVLRDLSIELQQELEFAATIAGLVVQRALFREEVQSHRLKTQTPETRGGTAARLMIGSSSALDAAYRFITRFAMVDIPVLIRGETGTGKELAAREVHLRSSRANKNFVSVNASAIPENLFESELFGHKKGAYTGAIADREGLVERAAGGTLFIDEIGEIPILLQAKLLRVLQEKSVVRVGESQARHVDFRLVAATHRDLLDMMKQGSFREDLYYRIAGGIVTLAPLRDRRDDVRILAQFFKNRFCEQHGLPQKEFSVEAVAGLLSYQWPGNIRELENAVCRAVVMADGLVIRSRDFGIAQLSHQSENDSIAGPSEEGTLEQAKEKWLRTFILSALEKNSQNRTNTARALGISERTLFRYLESLKVREMNH